MTFREQFQRWRYNLIPDHMIGEILDQAVDGQCHSVSGAGVHRCWLRHGHSRFLQASALIESTRQLGEFSIVVTGLTIVMLAGGIDLSVGSIFALATFAAVSSVSHFRPCRCGLGLLAAVATGCCVWRHQWLSDRLYAPAGLSDHARHAHHRPRGLRHSGGELCRADPACPRHLRHLGFHWRRHGISAFPISVIAPVVIAVVGPYRAHPLAARLAHAGGRWLAPFGAQFGHSGA